MANSNELLFLKTVVLRNCASKNYLFVMHLMEPKMRDDPPFSLAIFSCSLPNFEQNNRAVFLSPFKSRSI